MVYKLTVFDRYERIATQIWEASKTDDFNAFAKCIDELKSLKIAAGNRVEYAKCALQGLAAQPPNRGIELQREQIMAEKAFMIADEMMKAEGIE